MLRGTMTAGIFLLFAYRQWPHRQGKCDYCHKHRHIAKKYNPYYQLVITKTPYQLLMY